MQLIIVTLIALCLASCSRKNHDIITPELLSDNDSIALPLVAVDSQFVAGSLDVFRRAYSAKDNAPLDSILNKWSKAHLPDSCQSNAFTDDNIANLRAVIARFLRIGFLKDTAGLDSQTKQVLINNDAAGNYFQLPVLLDCRVTDTQIDTITDDYSFLNIAKAADSGKLTPPRLTLTKPVIFIFPSTDKVFIDFLKNNCIACMQQDTTCWQEHFRKMAFLGQSITIYGVDCAGGWRLRSSPEISVIMMDRNASYAVIRCVIGASIGALAYFKKQGMNWVLIKTITTWVI